MCVSDALDDIGKVQRQRVLNKINANARSLVNERMQGEMEGVQELIEELENDKGANNCAYGGSPNGKRSLADSTPPRLRWDG